MKKIYLVLLVLIKWTFIFSQDNCTSTLIEGKNNGTEICVKTNWEYNETPAFYLNTGSGTKKIEVFVNHLLGTEHSNGAPNEVVNKRIFTKTVAVGEDGCRAQFNQTIDNTCGRDGEFLITVKITHGLDGGGLFDDLCEDKHYAVYTSVFTILKNTSPPLPPFTSIAELVCPSSSTKLEIDEDLPFQSGARWYDFNTDNLVQIGYENYVPIQNGEVVNFDIAYTQEQVKTNRYEIYKSGDNWPRRNLPDETCTIESRRIPYTATALPLNTEDSPPPIVRTLCRPGNLEITVPNTNSNEYDDVFWYADPARTELVHTGFSWNNYYDQAYTIFYTEYVKDLGDCKQTSFIPATVKVFVLEDDIYNIISQANSNIFNGGTEGINDYRDFQGQTCTSNDNFFADLVPYEPQTLGTQVGVGQLEADVTISGFWESKYRIDDKTYVLRDGEQQGNYTANLFDQNNNEKIVCADHIGFQQGQYGSRNYFFQEQFLFTYKVLDQNGNEVDQQKTCPVNRSRVRITTEPLIGNDCETITREHVEQIDSGTLVDCDETNYRSICPSDDFFEIGPTDEQVNNLFKEKTGIDPTLLTNKSYQWIPTTGLSDANIPRPTTGYNQIPASVNDFQKYTLQITYSLGTAEYVFNYCEIIYKCGNCGVVNPTEAEGEILGNN